jgi:signal transduction histidine kinase
MIARAGAVALYVTLAAATVAIVDGAEEFALARDSPVSLAAELAAGALLLIAALSAQAWRGRRRFTAPLAAAALAWPLTEWNSPGAGPGFTIGLLLASAWAPLLAQAALSGPDERPLGRAGAATVAAGWLACAGLLGLAPATVTDQIAEGCFDCPANPLLISAHADLSHTLEQVGLTAAVVWAAAFLALVGVRMARSAPGRLRRAVPVLVPAATAVGLFAVDAVHSIDRGFMSNDATDHALWLAEAIAIALTAAGVAWERVRARRTRSAVARLVVELGSSATGGLQARLADRLGDPTLTLLYADRDITGWVDGAGVPAPHPEGATLVVATDRPLAAIVHRPGLLDDPALADEVAAGSRLALEHERLGALRSAQLAQLRASRARLVAAADAERLRLERDLHDGAQQRIVALALGVRLLRMQRAGTPLAAALAELETQLGAAVADLRQIAHGLFPAVLAEEGLDAALDVLSEQEPRLRRGAITDARFAPTVEATAYFLIAEVLQRAAPADIAVAVRQDDATVIVEIETDADIDGSRTVLEDRAGALGGTFGVDGRRLCAELPCAS